MADSWDILHEEKRNMSNASEDQAQFRCLVLALYIAVSLCGRLHRDFHAAAAVLRSEASRIRATSSPLSPSLRGV